MTQPNTTRPNSTQSNIVIWRNHLLYSVRLGNSISDRRGGGGGKTMCQAPNGYSKNERSPFHFTQFFNTRHIFFTQQKKARSNIAEKPLYPRTPLCPPPAALTFCETQEVLLDASGRPIFNNDTRKHRQHTVQTKLSEGPGIDYYGSIAPLKPTGE